jgi:hypothetical protein
MKRGRHHDGPVLFPEVADRSEIMSTIHNAETLEARIRQLELLHRQKSAGLRDDLAAMYERYKPSAFIKEAFGYSSGVGGEMFSLVLSEVLTAATGRFYPKNTNSAVKRGAILFTRYLLTGLGIKYSKKLKTLALDGLGVLLGRFRPKPAREEESPEADQTHG